MKKSLWLLSGLLLLLLLAGGCAGRRNPPQPVARVNGVTLTVENLDREMRHTRAYYLAQYNVDLEAPENAVLRDNAEQEALERIIDQELVRQVAGGLFPKPEGAPTPVVTITDEEIAARIDQYIAQAGDLDSLLRQNGFVNRSELADFVRGELQVEKLFQVYGQAEMVRARHILVATEEEALQVLERLQAGEDFAQIARELSLDGNSAANGGELDWFGRGVMVPSFEKTAFSLEIGAYSNPVQTQYGFHIIQVLERQARPDPMAFQQWFAGIKAQAEIERLVGPTPQPTE